MYLQSHSTASYVQLWRTNRWTRINWDKYFARSV